MELPFVLGFTLLAPDLVVGRRLDPGFDTQDGRGKQRIVARPDRPSAMLRDEDLLCLHSDAPGLGEEVMALALFKQPIDLADFQQALSDDSSRCRLEQEVASDVDGIRRAKLTGS